MTNTDKTREKLVESMRKTKADKADTPSPKAAPPRKKKTDTRRAGTKPTGRGGDAASSYRQPVSDPYQYGRRVWPD